MIGAKAMIGIGVRGDHVRHQRPAETAPTGEHEPDTSASPEPIANPPSASWKVNQPALTRLVPVVQNALAIAVG